MDGKMIKLTDGKPWTCENGHLLGVMRRERIGAGHGYRLYVLNTAQTDPEPVTAMAWKMRAEGTCYDIRCEICGSQQTWWAGQAALDALVKSVFRRSHETV